MWSILVIVYHTLNFVQKTIKPVYETFLRIVRSSSIQLKCFQKNLPHLTLLPGIAWHFSITTSTTACLQLFHFCSSVSHGTSCWVHLLLQPLSDITNLVLCVHHALITCDLSWNSTAQCDSLSLVLHRVSTWMDSHQGAVFFLKQ